MSQTGCFVGWSFLFNFGFEHIFIMQKHLQWFMSCFIVDYYSSVLHKVILLRECYTRLPLMAAASFRVRHPRVSRASAALLQAVCRHNRPVACSPALLFVVPITSAGAPPPLLRSQAHHQPLAGNRSESRWVTTLREGGSSAYHVSKVDTKAPLNETRGEMWCGRRDGSH